VQVKNPGRGGDFAEVGTGGGQRRPARLACGEITDAGARPATA